MILKIIATAILGVFELLLILGLLGLAKQNKRLDPWALIWLLATSIALAALWA